MHKKQIRKSKTYLNEIDRKLDRQKKQNPPAYKRNEIKLATVQRKLARLAR